VILFFFFAQYRPETRFAISVKLSEKQARLEYKAFAVGWFIGADRQTTRNKKLIHPSVLWQFQGFWEEKTFCTENFRQLRQFGLSCSFVKAGGPR